MRNVNGRKPGGRNAQPAAHSVGLLCKKRWLGIRESLGYDEHRRYSGSMTALLEEALRRVESLSQEDQDAIAAQIMETLDDEAAWERSFRAKPELLRSMAREALAEHRRGETRPLNELIE